MESKRTIAIDAGSSANDLPVYREYDQVIANRTNNDGLHCWSLTRVGDIPDGYCFSNKPIVHEPLINAHNSSVQSSNSVSGPSAFEVMTKVVVSHKINNPTRLQDRVIESIGLGTLRIISPSLISILLTYTNYSPFFNGPLDPNRAFIEPYYDLLPYYPKLQDLVSTGRIKDAASLRNLLDFLSPYAANYLTPAASMLDCPTSKTQVFYNSLWYLFPRGTEVYFRDAQKRIPGRHIGALVKSFVYDQADFVLELCTLVIRKGTVGTRPFIIKIPRWSGLMPVLSLSCCPAKFMDESDGGVTRSTCLESCRSFLTLISSRHPEMYYEGPVKVMGARGGVPFNSEYKGSVIFDHDSALVENFESASRLGTFLCLSIDDTFEIPPEAFVDSPTLDPQWWSKGSTKPVPDPTLFSSWSKRLTERHALIFEYQSIAYAVKDKNWLAINIDHLKTIKRRENPLKNVIIPQENIELIKALSFRRIDQEPSWGIDFIQGKGIGKIVLLHGPPGVGKTYTVECIAEAFEMPLLFLSIANVSLGDRFLEKDLETWFLLAERWEAILLLDEADVFLERRRPADLERNALVAALLRHVEYYTGLLFLTTNRVGQIDDAFASRIHVIIGFDKINKDARSKIWTAFFEKLEIEKEGQIIVGSMAKNYVLTDPEIAKLNWNGREIRNALQTVIALASYQASQSAKAPRSTPIIIEEAHFRQYMRMSKAYHDYLFAISSQDESTRAQARKDRNDYFLS